MAARKSALRFAGCAVLTGATVWFTIWWAGDGGWRNAEFWLGASFIWLGWAVSLDEFIKLKVTLPRPYYAIMRFEANGSLYKALGVHVFKRFMVNGDYMNRIKRARDPKFRLVRTMADALRWERDSRAAEAAHLGHLVLLVPAVVLAAAAGRFTFAASTLLLLLGFDLYPVLVQRYNRSRIVRMTGASTLRL